MKSSIKNRLYFITLMGLIIGIGSSYLSEMEPFKNSESQVKQAVDSKWVDFTPSPYIGLRYKFEYTFTDGLSLNFIRWDFGDGSPEIEDDYDNPYYYTFPSPGEYEVKFTVRFTGDSEEYQQKYPVTVEEQPGIDFEFHQTQEYEYSFTHLIPDVGTVSFLKWDFGDGGDADNSMISPIFHTYTEDGTYYITLAVLYEGDPEFHTVTHELVIGKDSSAGGDNNVPDPLSFIPSYPIGLLSLFMVLGCSLIIRRTLKRKSK